MATQAISEDYEYFEIEFDSLDAQNAGSATAQATDWPLFNFARPLNNIAAIKVLEVQIPFTYYVFNRNNNKFILNAVNLTNAVVTIPVGNYDANGLATAMAAALTAACAGVTPLPWTWTVTYSGANSAPSLGTFTFKIGPTADTVGNPFSFTFGTTSDTGNFTPRIMLGFNGGTINSTFVSGAGNTITSPNVNLITGPNYMYLNSRKIGSLCNLFLPASATNLGNGTLGPQMAKIPVNVQPQGVIYWSDPCPNQFFNVENLANISEIDFYFTLGNTSSLVPLEFNGQGFSVKLGVLIYKPVANISFTGANAEKVYRRMIPR